MTPKQIRSRLLLIKSALMNANAELKILQNECTHEGLIVEHRGNTGNYDPSNNCYWTENTCPVCEKYWTEDQ